MQVELVLVFSTETFANVIDKVGFNIRTLTVWWKH